MAIEAGFELGRQHRFFFFFQVKQLCVCSVCSPLSFKYPGVGEKGQWHNEWLPKSSLQREHLRSLKQPNNTYSWEFTMWWVYSGPRVYKNWKFQSSRSWVYNSLYPWVIVAAIRLKASKSSHCEERWLADNNKLILRCGVICHPQTPILPHATPKPRLFYTWKNSSVLHVRYQRW